MTLPLESTSAAEQERRPRWRTRHLGRVGATSWSASVMSAAFGGGSRGGRGATGPPEGVRRIGLPLDAYDVLASRGGEVCGGG